ncbi:MAG: CpsB/CapC family capsule biosynthesis tyrosine phosphatase [candidate division WOR-3 bacterium]
MIDIHNHLLYGIDDGPKDLETSLAMLKIAQNDGIKEIVLTPHIAEEFRYEIDQVKQNFETLKEKAKQESIQIKLHLGFEVRIDKDLIKKYEDNINVLTINEIGKYILLEFPFLDIPLYYKEIIKYFTSQDITPIIVHPFRNRKIFSNISFIEELLNLGVLFQFNTDDVLNKSVFSLFLKVFKKNLVHFVSSDAHSIDLRPPILSSSYNVIEKNFGKNVATKIFYENPSKVIEGKFLENRVLNNFSFFDRIKNIFKKEEED